MSYSVVREAALGLSLPKETREADNALERQERARRRQDRWEILLRMLQELGRRRVTAQQFRAAIGARPIPNSASAMTAEKIVDQLDRPDVRSAVMASVMEPAFLVEAFAADPMVELKIRDSLAQVAQATGNRESASAPEETDERLVLQFRRRVNLLYGVVEMHPEQIINIADEDMLNDLEKACEALCTGRSGCTRPGRPDRRVCGDSRRVRRSHGVTSTGPAGCGASNRYGSSTTPGRRW
ncbi:hypothetical protein [Streptomyces xanthochromogenes]|uniref:hypothetical protein n=1 Tax=Streptomyces xanthochromogenes TaxID=67384 RepID=UPI002F402BF4